MSFKELARKKEIHYVQMLLSCFKTIREDQLREFFSYMNPKAYRILLVRLKDDNVIRYDKNAMFISSDSNTANEHDEFDILCCDVLLNFREYMNGLSPADKPSIIAFSARGKAYDIIPVRSEEIESINNMVDPFPKEAYRILVLMDKELLSKLNFREKNDYVYLSLPNGEKELFEMKEEENAD